MNPDPCLPERRHGSGEFAISEIIIKSGGGAMQLTRFAAAKDFRPKAEDFLVAHETQHNVILGLMNVLIHKPDAYPSQPYFAVVTEADKVIAAALMTPPHKLVLSLCSDLAALRHIAQDVREFRPMTPGVVGPAPVSRQFADVWQELTGETSRLKMAERIYRLDQVIHPIGVRGHMRPANSNDRVLLHEWLLAFQADAFGEADEPAARQTLENMLTLPPDYRGTFLWEDEQPVCLVCYGGPTPNSMRIGPVYTPPEFRRKGYASACTAAVSQLLLDSGRRFCTLFTDLTNRTSNRIYQQIGYKAVCDVDEYQFVNFGDRP